MKKIISALLMIVFLSSTLFGCDLGTKDYIQVTHIIDADRGMPYTLEYNEETGRFVNKTDCVISATIISEDSARADAYATAVCVMGLEKGTDFLKSKNLNAIIFTQDKRMSIVGDVALTDSEFNEYKEFALYYGNPSAPSNEIIEADYTTKYKDYRGNIFANTIEYRLTLMGNDTDSVKNVILEEWEAIEKAVNLNDTDSELSRFNNIEAEKRMEISELTYKMLREAVSVYEETSGAFNPSVVTLSRMWNVDIQGIKQYRPYPGSSSRYWEYPASLPTIEEIETAKANCSMDNLELYDEDGKYYALKHRSDFKLDMGGIAKGYAVNTARDICRERGITSAIINISGNMYLINSKVDGSVQPWTVNITSPTERNPLIRDNIAQMSIAGNVSIVTSGDYQRFYFYGYEK